MLTIDVKNWLAGAGADSPAASATSAGAVDSAAVDEAVRQTIEAVRAEGDVAIRRYAAKFDRSSPEKFEVAPSVIAAALFEMRRDEGDLVEALQYVIRNLEAFARAQREQLSDFEIEIDEGLFTGQRVIPVDKAAVYVPAGRFPLLSSVLMGVIPAKIAGVREIVVTSPPLEDGCPDKRILAAAALAGADKVYAMGGAQAIAALSLGTQSVGRVDVVVGPGNKYVASAKKQLFGEIGIDFVAGPTDVLIIADEEADADLVAADMLAQAEHDTDARARALVPSVAFARAVSKALERRLSTLTTAETAKASLVAGGLLLIYNTRSQAIEAADRIAPEHLELHLADAQDWVPLFRNYGSLFIGSRAVEALGDYSAGINHTLPTSGSARFTGGLSVRHFLKVVTTLRGPADNGGAEAAVQSSGYLAARKAAIRLAQAEGLAGHEESAKSRG
ncbi:histidinol dehydrogenase [Treponema sp.]